MEQCVSQSQRKAEATRLLFSIFVISDNKKGTIWKELWAIFSLHNRGNNVCAWIPDSLMWSHRCLFTGHTKTRRSAQGCCSVCDISPRILLAFLRVKTSEVKVKHAGSLSYYRCILVFSTESCLQLLPKACLVSRVCGSWWISHWILFWRTRVGGEEDPLFDVCLLPWQLSVHVSVLHVPNTGR